MELVARYVEAHNEGVRTGNYASLGALLAEDAEMRFEGVRAGPYSGRAAIVRAFSEGGPGDELVIRDVKEEAGEAVAIYGWKNAAALAEGTIRIAARGGRIVRVTVRAFGAPR